MGNQVAKPPPPPDPWKPGNCPTIFECHGKRAEVIKDTFYEAYEHHALAVHCVACLLFLVFVVGIGVTYWTVLHNRKTHHSKRAEACLIEAEKHTAGAFPDEV